MGDPQDLVDKYERHFALGADAPAEEAETGSGCKECGAVVFHAATEDRIVLCASCYGKLDRAIRTAASRGFHLGL